jgi:hypothetical protein
MPLEGFDDADIPPRDMGRRSGPGSGPVIDYTIAERASGIGCTQEEIAALLGITRETLRVHTARDRKLQDALEVGSAKGRAALRRFQWKGAEEGNATMLVWLGKQLLGQQDSLTLTADLNIHRVLSEAPLTIEQWTALNVITKPDDET